jgi:hypothetical protein
MTVQEMEAHSQQLYLKKGIPYAAYDYRVTWELIVTFDCYDSARQWYANGWGKRRVYNKEGKAVHKSD